MQPQNTQIDMSPEEAFAALGLATRLNEEMLMQQNTPQKENVEENDIINDNKSDSFKDNVMGILNE